MDHFHSNILILHIMIIFILIVTAILPFQNALADENTNTKRIVYPRQAQYSFANFVKSTNEIRPVPFVTASPRSFQTEEKSYESSSYQQQNRNIPQIQLTTNFSEIIPNIQIQESAVFHTPPQIIKTTVTNHHFQAHAPVSFKGSTTTVEQILEYEWSTFKKTFNKSYPTFEDERIRREIFIENRNKVARFNQEYGTGHHNFVQKLNGFADMLHHEFNAKLNGFNSTKSAQEGRSADVPAPERKSSAFIKSANVGLPYTVDWREIGAVTNVKFQGDCGACYAFAAVGALEGQKFRRTGHLQNLSPQNLIDCTVEYSNDGCVGGVTEYAYEYIKDNKGVDTEHFYPYEARDNLECRYRRDGYGAHVTGYVLLDEDDEQALESAVATVGPIAVAIDASPDSFQFYSNGVYFDPQCKSSIDDLNHAVLVVGYGTEPNGQKYWLIKNSYGPEWGIGGYMKISKFSNNQCGIATYASYPLV